MINHAIPFKIYGVYMSDPTEDGEAMMDGPEKPAWADIELFEPNEAGEDPSGNDAEKERPLVYHYSVDLLS